MKKLFMAVMIFAIALSLVACSGGKSMSSMKDAIKIFEENGFNGAVEMPAEDLKGIGAGAKEGVQVDSDKGTVGYVRFENEAALKKALDAPEIGEMFGEDLKEGKLGKNHKFMEMEGIRVDLITKGEYLFMSFGATTEDEILKFVKALGF